eukprot:GEMP01039162.1.p1 GENE.GEMP01039162.1~~GEMP01039162.1.p1  ORF type:complete len:387 (+),score=59.89 GEMP01039162.1:47-1207(+)
MGFGLHIYICTLMGLLGVETLARTATSPDNWWYADVVDTASCDELFKAIHNEMADLVDNVGRWKNEIMTKQTFVDTIETERYHPHAAATMASGAHVERFLQQIALLVLARRTCFGSRFRWAFQEALLPLQKMWNRVLNVMWHSLDNSVMSDYGNPGQHWKQLITLFQLQIQVLNRVQEELESPREDTFLWGHRPEGMFLHTQVMHRMLFPHTSLIDKGILRTILRFLPRDSTIADLGAFHGHYTRWLNDTGLFRHVHGFDGIKGIALLTDDLVTEADLTKPLDIESRSYDYVLCVEVAEHIPAEHEATFLANLQIARKGLILSWAPPGVEGHVNCQPIEESRRKVEALGFHQNETITAMLRDTSELAWIAKSIAFYEREDYTTAEK